MFPVLADRPRASTKRALPIGMLERPEGASVAELGQRLGWLRHTVRAAITGLRHAGREVIRSKDAEGRSVYRLDPAGIEDCLHATRWAALYATELGANPMRIAVAGDSAGANIAAVTALRVRDEGGPALCGQLLLYPVTDYHTPGTPSY